MRRRIGTRGFFLGLGLKSLGVLILLPGLMVVFGRSFGELAIPAINMMAGLLWIPVLTFLIGALGYFLSD